MKLTDKSPSAAKKVLIYGAPKTGKTRLFGSLAEHFKLIDIDCENGWETLLQIPDEFKDNVEIISLPDTRSFPIAIETCLKIIKGGPVDICEEHGKVSCAVCKKENKPFTNLELNKLGPEYIICFDSLTQITNSAIAHITKNKPDDYKLEYDDWANLGKLMDMFLSHVQNAKFNIVCISHETETEMEDGKVKLVPTAGTRNFSRNTARYFGEVVYCEVKNGKHIAASATTYSNKVLTGSRSGIRLEDSPEASLLRLFGKESAITPKVETSPSVNTSGMSKLEQFRAGMKK